MPERIGSTINAAIDPGRSDGSAHTTGLAPLVTVADEVLETWRDAERLLDTLPPIDPDHETVRLAVAYLRLTYEAVTNGDTFADRT